MTTTTLHSALPANYTQEQTSVSAFSKFMAWCEAQQGNRLLWLGLILAAHGCILTPLTLMMVFLGGASITLFMTAMVAMAMALVTNLAAMPTKITVPVFFLSLAIDAAIMVACLVAML